MKDNADRHVVAWLPGNKPKESIIDVVLLLILGVVVTMSLVLQYLDPNMDWFRRSGAIIVLIGAVMEYRHNGFVRNADIESIKWASGIGGSVIFEQTSIRKFFGYLAHVCVIVGTFIAAYGDFIYKKFS